MTQKCLNNLVIFHSYQQRTDKLEPLNRAVDFISKIIEDDSFLVVVNFVFLASK